MAVVVTLLDHGAASGTGGASNSITPGANCALLLFVGGNPDGTNVFTTPTAVSSGSGPAWTLRTSADSGSFQASGSLHTATIGASDPGSFTVTWTSSNPNVDSGNYSIVRITGHNTAGPFVGATIQTDQNGDGAETLTLPTAPFDGDAVVGFSWCDADDANTGAVEGAGWSELFDTGGLSGDGQSYGGGNTIYRTDATSTSVDWTDVNTGTGNFGSMQMAIIVRADTTPVVAQYAETSNWNAGSSPSNVTGLAWNSGDIIVVATGVENSNAGGGALATATPSNANLTFGEQAGVPGSGDSAEARVSIFLATAGSSQTSQTIAVNVTAGGGQFGAAVWVIRGATGSANADANLSESSFSKTVLAKSVVIVAVMDWNTTNPPGKTPLTGSGTATERRDLAGSNFSQWIADWVGVSAGTFSFGPNNYTSLKVAQAIIEVTAAPIASAQSGVWAGLGTNLGFGSRRV